MLAGFTACSNVQSQNDAQKNETTHIVLNEITAEKDTIAISDDPVIGIIQGEDLDALYEIAKSPYQNRKNAVDNCLLMVHVVPKEISNQMIRNDSLFLPQMGDNLFTDVMVRITLEQLDVLASQPGILAVVQLSNSENTIIKIITSDIVFPDKVAQQAETNTVDI